MQRGEDLLAEHRPHDLADGVGGDHPGDPEAAGEHGGDRRLANSGGPAKKDDEGDVEAVHHLPLGERLGVSVTHLGAKDVEGQSGELGRADRGPLPLVEAILHDLGHAEGTRRRQTGGHDRRSHQALGIRELGILVADHDVSLVLLHAVFMV